MNGIGADEKFGNFKVMVGRGLTKDRKDEYTISIRQTCSDPFTTTLLMISCSAAEWEKLVTIVANLKENISGHTLSIEE